MGCYIGGILLHTSKLVNMEEGIINTNSLLSEEYRKPIFNKYKKRYQNDKRRKKN
jgi:hypothetical protein